MLDCGVNVAATGSGAYPYLNVPEFKLEELDAVILSHAHLDHCGFVPYLYKYGYKGPTYCTPATRDLSVLLQIDYVDIAQREAKKIPYSKKDIKTFIQHSISVDYSEVTDITNDMRMTLYNAGHILGSSQIHLHVGEGLHNLIYSGDMQFAQSYLLEKAESNFMRLETLILESTYGGRQDITPTRQQAVETMVNMVTQVMGRGGKILIPVLAVGRAQEVMIILEDWIRKNKLEYKVYLDGMIWDSVAIHTAYPEYLSKKLRQQIFHEDSNPFMSGVFSRIGSAKERKALIEGNESCIILATSGMLQGGASVEYLRNLADNPKNGLIFVAYQPEGSLGKRIQKGWDKVSIEKYKGGQEQVEIKLQVETIRGLGGHSDRSHLMKYVGSLNPRPDRVLIDHGDHIKTLDLASSIHKQFRIDTYAPKNLETIRLR